MKNKILPVLSVMLLWACAAPKYSYHFDHYDYNSGRKNAAELATASQPVTETSPLIIDEQKLTASAEPSSAIAPADKKIIADKISSMTKSERKTLKQDLKEVMKKYSRVIKKDDHGQVAKATKEMDHDLKLAIIFGAVGVALSLFSGVSEFFWVLAVIALIVGIVFLIKWLSRQ
jgi:hypothetical protein